MSTNVVPINPLVSQRALAVFGGMSDNDDLSSGVTGGFAVISIRGGKWRIKHAGDEVVVTNDEGDPVGSLKVLMVKASPDISKNYYEGGYVEGSTDAPSCWSIDGKKPDASIESPVHPVCVTCPKNVFGSRVSENGSKGKACADVRRVVILPIDDLENEAFGGPMLLRVPAASLVELSSFGKAMKDKGFPYNTIATKISFDPDTAYPRLKFQASRPITDAEADQMQELLADTTFREKMEYILNKPVDITPVVEAEVVAPPPPVVQKPKDPTEFEDVVPEAAASPAAGAKTATFGKPAAVPPATAAAPRGRGRPRSAPAAKPDAPPPEPPAEAATEGGGEIADDDLDSILAKLDGLN